MEKLRLFVQNISYILDYDIDNRVKVRNIHLTWNCPKGMSMPVWLELSQLPKKHLIYRENFIYFSPPVNSKLRSRSAIFNDLLRLVTMIFLCKFEVNPSTGSKDILLTSL